MFAVVNSRIVYRRAKIAMVGGLNGKRNAEHWIPESPIKHGYPYSLSLPFGLTAHQSVFTILK